jgi:hypothetical protein
MHAKALPNIGSIWRKWDFHIHTPASYHWKGKRFRHMTEEEVDEACHAIIRRLNESDSAAFVVMDYWTFDGYNQILAYLSVCPDIALHKTLFPGIELRCEAPTKDRLNIHVIFSNELPLQYLIDFKSKLHIPLVDRPLSDDALAAVARKLNRSPQ